jgi:putative endonuclease
MSSWASISPAELGRLGERVAATWLRLKGYRIVARNLRVGGREVDIVAMRRGVLVVCEVKARRHDGRGTALDAIDEYKARRLSAAAQMLLERHPEARELRIDVITIDGWRLRHLPGIVF